MGMWSTLVNIGEKKKPHHASLSVWAKGHCWHHPGPGLDLRTHAMAAQEIISDKFGQHPSSVRIAPSFILKWEPRTNSHPQFTNGNAPTKTSNQQKGWCLTIRVWYWAAWHSLTMAPRACKKVLHLSGPSFGPLGTAATKATMAAMATRGTMAAGESFKLIGIGLCQAQHMNGKNKLLSSSDPHPDTLFWYVSDISSKSIDCIYIYIFIIYSNNLSDILSGIYPDILCDTHSGILFGIHSDIHSGILFGIYSDILSNILSYLDLFSILSILSNIQIYSVYLFLSGILSGMRSGPGTLHSIMGWWFGGPGDLHCIWQGYRRGGRKERGKKWVAPLLKPTDPHLAGGEKIYRHRKRMDFLKEKETNRQDSHWVLKPETQTPNQHNSMSTETDRSLEGCGEETTWQKGNRLTDLPGRVPPGMASRAHPGTPCQAVKLSIGRERRWPNKAEHGVKRTASRKTALPNWQEKAILFSSGL